MPVCISPVAVCMFVWVSIRMCVRLSVVHLIYTEPGGLSRYEEWSSGPVPSIKLDYGQSIRHVGQLTWTHGHI